MRKLYFAHPINTYHTPLETLCIEILRKNFPGHEIVNPSDKVHEDMVEKLREKDPSVNVMPYFEKLAAESDDIVVLAFGDGKWGTGVYSEAAVIKQKHGDAYEVLPKKNSVLRWNKLPEERRLSVDETRARVRNPDRTIRPYE